MARDVLRSGRRRREVGAVRGVGALRAQRRQITLVVVGERPRVVAGRRGVGAMDHPMLADAPLLAAGETEVVAIDLLGGTTGAVTENRTVAALGAGRHV